MSSCLAVQCKEFIYIAADSMLCGYKGDEVINVKDDTENIHVVDGKVLFTWGDECLTNAIIKNYTKSEDKSIQNLREIIMQEHHLFINSLEFKNLENRINAYKCVVATWEGNEAVLYEMFIDGNGICSKFNRNVSKGKEIEALGFGLEGERLARNIGYYFNNMPDYSEIHPLIRMNFFFAKLYEKVYSSMECEHIGGKVTLIKLERNCICKVGEIKLNKEAAK